MRTERKAIRPEVSRMLEDVAAINENIKYEKPENPKRFNMPVIPHAREKTVLDDLLKSYKNKISCMRAIMRLPKSEIRDIAMNAILEAFTK